jgi:hypothetical protein
MSPITESDTPHRLSRWIAVHIARYDGIAASRHLDVLNQDRLAATRAYAVNRKQRLLAHLHHASSGVRDTPHSSFVV